MTVRQKTFVDQQVLTAAQVNDNLRDVTTIDTVGELSSVDLGIYVVFCKQNRRLYTRQVDSGNTWEMYAPLSATGGYVSAPLNTSALRAHYNSAVVQIANTAGGVQVPYGTTFSTAINSVFIVPGDSTGGVAQVVPLASQVTLTAAVVQCFQTNGSPVPNGTNVRLNVAVVGW